VAEAIEAGNLEQSEPAKVKIHRSKFEPVSVRVPRQKENNSLLRKLLDKIRPKSSSAQQE